MNNIILRLHCTILFGWCCLFKRLLCSLQCTPPLFKSAHFKAPAVIINYFCNPLYSQMGFDQVLGLGGEGRHTKLFIIISPSWANEMQCGANVGSTVSDGRWVGRSGSSSSRRFLSGNVSSIQFHLSHFIAGGIIHRDFSLVHPSTPSTQYTSSARPVPTYMSM